MSLFEFVVGMISLLIALAIAQLLVSCGRLVRHHRQVRAYLPHTLWCINLFLIAFLHWWSLWDFRDLPWNSAMFLFSLMGPMLLFFGVSILNPEPVGNESVDLREHYTSVRVVFLVTQLSALLFLTLDGPLFGTEATFNSLRVIQLLMAAGLVLALAVRAHWAQWVASGVLLMVLISATAVRYLPGAIL